MIYSLLLKNATLILPHTIAQGSVAISRDRVEAIIPEDVTPPTADNIIDLEGAFLAPGFVDLHIHGAAGVDIMEADSQELDRLGRWLAERGVTRFVPTLIPTTDQGYRDAVERIASCISRALVAPPTGAIPVGIHFEGPFLAASRCGALRSVLFRTSDGLGRFLDAAGGPQLDGLPARMITVAPEVAGDSGLIETLVAKGFIVSMGHTEADLPVLDRAFEAGAHHMTHFMNAMPPMHHREPGPVGWGLLKRGLSVDVIADLHHLHPEALRLVIGARSSTRVALISDSVPPAGLGDGEFNMWGSQVEARDGTIRNHEGRLAGSSISVGDAVRNLAMHGFSLLEAVRMASIVPARVLRIDSLGAIANGHIADLVAFRDDVKPFLTIVAGTIVYHATT